MWFVSPTLLFCGMTFLSLIINMLEGTYLYCEGFLIYILLRLHFLVLLVSNQQLGADTLVLEFIKCYLHFDSLCGCNEGLLSSYLS